MVKIEIELNDVLYTRINEIVSYYEDRKKLQKQDLNMSIDQFITKAIERQVHDIDNLIKPFEPINERGVLKNNFKTIAKREGFSQTDLKLLTGTSDSGISTIFNNKSQPNLDTFLILWSALNFPPISEILYREEEK